MSPEQFVYWLQGYTELTEEVTPNDKQWLIIKDHLKEVFNKLTPERTFDIPVWEPPEQPPLNNSYDSPS